MKLFYLMIIMILNFNLLSIEIINNKYVIVDVDNLFLRESPGIKSKIITKFKKGDILKIISVEKNISVVNNIENYWYKVEKESQIGFVFGYYISKYKDNFIINDNEIIIINEKQAEINKIDFISYNLAKKIKKQKKIEDKEINYQQVDNLNNKILIIKDIMGIEDSECLIKKFRIYNSNGKEIYDFEGYPLIYYVDNYDYIIINKTKDSISFLNEIEILNTNGNMIKKIKFDMGLLYNEEAQPINYFLFNLDKDKFIWINNSKIMVINLNNLSFNIKNINIKDIDIKNDIVTLAKSPAEKEKKLYILINYLIKKDNYKLKRLEFIFEKL